MEWVKRPLEGTSSFGAKRSFVPKTGTPRLSSEADDLQAFGAQACLRNETRRKIQRARPTVDVMIVYRRNLVGAHKFSPAEAKREIAL